MTISLKRLLVHQDDRFKKLDEAVSTSWPSRGATSAGGRGSHRLSGPRRPPKGGWPSSAGRGRERQSMGSSFTSDASKPDKDVAVKELTALLKMANAEARYQSYIESQLKKWIQVRKNGGRWTPQEVKQVIELIRGNGNRVPNAKTLAVFSGLAKTVR